MKNIIFALIFVFVTVSPPPLKAEDGCVSLVTFYDSASPKPTPFKMKDRFSTNWQNGCYGKGPHSALWTNEFNDIVGNHTNENAVRKARSGVDFLMGKLNSADGLMHKALLNKAIQEWKQTLYGDDVENIRNVTSPDNWSYLPDEHYFGAFGNPLIDVGGIIEEVCYSNDSEAYCGENLRKLSDVAPFIHSISRLSSILSKYKLEEAIQGLTLIESRWEAYFNDARPQNIVETTANAYYSNWRRKQGCSTGVGEQDKESKSECLLALGASFFQPPSSQIILLNPSVALEYLPDSPDGEQLKESLVLEIAGFNRWKWEGAKRKSNFGASIIATYSDRQDVDDLGYGVLFYFGNKFSVGATKRSGGHEGFFINVDLRNYLFKWTDSKEKKYRSYKDAYDKFSSKK